ncbi:MAG: rod shape-determining protein [Lentisphaeria bacterium]|nr:rod shape-determining protein [Lentisphaeria bacterium]
MKKNPNIFTGIELGSDCIRVVVASFRTDGLPESRPSPDSELIVLGFAEVPSHKILKDEPAAPNIVAEQLSTALRNAWMMTGLNDFSGVISIILSGAYIRSEVVSASIDLDERMAITENDSETAMKAIYDEVEKLLSVQNALPLPLVCRDFRLADDRMLFNPAGQFSSKLTAESICFFADADRYGPIEGLVKNALPDVKLDYVIYAPIAAACSVLPPVHTDEPQGLLIDLGAGMTSLAIPTRMGFVTCEQIAIGTEHLANDLSIALGLDIHQARDIVSIIGTTLQCTVVATNDGSARMLYIPDSKNPSITHNIPASQIEKILEVRLTELFQLVKSSLEQHETYDWAGNEIILTGVGATLPRITELAKKIFNRNVRIGVPYKISGRPDFPLSPKYAMVPGAIRSSCVEEGLHEIQRANSNIVEKLKNIWRAVVDC